MSVGSFEVSTVQFSPSLTFFGSVHENDTDFDDKIERVRFETSRKRMVNGRLDGSLTDSKLDNKWNEANCDVTYLDEPFPVYAKKIGNDVLQVENIFVKHLDGHVVYIPKMAYPFVIVFMHTDKEDKPYYLAVKFDGTCSVLIKPLIRHSFPICLEHDISFDIKHRKTFGIKVDRRSGNYLKINLKANIETELETLKVVDLYFHEEKNKSKKTSDIREPDSTNFNASHYYQRYMITEETAKDIQGFGELVNLNDYEDENPTLVNWKDSDYGSRSGKLNQRFTMTWIDKDGGDKDLQFAGLSGGFKGAVCTLPTHYRSKEDQYTFSWIMSSVDGSFFMRCLTPGQNWTFTIIRPLACGEPDFMKAFTVLLPSTIGVRLNPFVWHSAPMPLCNTAQLTFEETIVETDAGNAIPLEEEFSQNYKFENSVFNGDAKTLLERLNYPSTVEKDGTNVYSTLFPPGNVPFYPSNVSHPSTGPLNQESSEAAQSSS
uniref:SHR-BD domain-containing protein n=1 Tax=Rhabditophanes sp. KR3021 TaxID=114890 RepID=A0AC35TYK9_9BILA